MTGKDDVAEFDARLTKLERAVDYIEKSVDLCVNALREIARTHCPVHVVAGIESSVIELRKHRTDPAPPLEIEDPFPTAPNADTPEPKWRKP